MTCTCSRPRLDRTHRPAIAAVVAAVGGAVLAVGLALVGAVLAAGLAAAASGVIGGIGPTWAPTAWASSAGVSDEATVTIVWVGDVHFGRGVAEGMAQPGHADPLDRVGPLLRDADLRVANLEGPLTTAPRAVYGYDLTGEPGSVALLAGAGFDLVGLGNNHATDNGGTGLQETRDLLSASGIASVGAGTLEDAHAPAIFARNGLRVAVLAFNYIPGAVPASRNELGVAGYDSRVVVPAVRSARQLADLVIVTPHWGVEYAPEANGYQRRFARELVDAGADAVIGHHPHVVQDVEWLARAGRRPAFVAYSLGNLVFDGLDEDAQRGALVWTQADRRGIRRFRALPVRTDWLGAQPAVGAADRQALMARMCDPSAACAPAPSSDGHVWLGAPFAPVGHRVAAAPFRRCEWMVGRSTAPLER